MPYQLSLTIHLITASYIENHRELNNYINAYPNLNCHLANNPAAETFLWQPLLKRDFPMHELKPTQTSKSAYISCFQYALDAVSNNDFAYKFSSNALKNNKELLLAAIRNNPEAMSYTSPALQEQSSEIFAELNQQTTQELAACLTFFPKNSGNNSDPINSLISEYSATPAP